MTFGGTWRTHTYPGIRSDSDLYTFGYRFKPWTSAPITTGTATETSTGEVTSFTANFLWMCQRYYRHNEGYTPGCRAFADKGQADWPD